LSGFLREVIRDRNKREIKHADVDAKALSVKQIGVSFQFKGNFSLAASYNVPVGVTFL
jgi:hypothetical protein